jgi:hypothetical protein
MGIPVEKLQKGDHIIAVVQESIVEANVEFLSHGEEKVYVGFGHHMLAFSPGENVQRGVVNLVPTEKKDGWGRPGKTPYEVLLFHTDFEYERTESEPEMKKRIVAKFRGYSEALLYAQQQALCPANAHVVLRA